MNVDVTDRLEPLGTAIGALLVLIGIATVVGTPWAYKSGSVVVAAGQIVGALAAVAVGLGLVWLARA